ncbi:MAG: hypothetical protein AAGF26_01285, partial [Cyanobacteria bacterium P01_G01_bin.49]
QMGYNVEKSNQKIKNYRKILFCLLSISMNNFLSGIAITLSTIALALSGWTVYQFSQLQSSITQQQNSLSEQQESIAQLSQKIEENETQLSSKISQPIQSTETTTDQPNNGIQPGQFVQQAYDNKVKIELLSVKRIENPKSEEKDAVVVQMQVRRIVPKGKKADSMILSQVKARNPETSEVYTIIGGKRTNSTNINNLPEDAWANAYFWLEVPEGIDVIDIVIPRTEIIEKVPISS